MLKRNSFFYILVFMSLFILVYEVSKIYKGYNIIESNNGAMKSLLKSYIAVLRVKVNQETVLKSDLNLTIENNLKNLESWLTNNREEILRFNLRDILTDHLMLSKCWKNVLIKNHSNLDKCIQYYETIKKAIENRKVQEIQNIKTSIYISILVLIVFLLISFKIAKDHINSIIERNIIYDRESRLYSYYYCIDIIKKLCSQSDRLNKPLSAIFIELNPTNGYSQVDKKMVIEGVGEYLASTTRLSDIACRYMNSSFLVLIQNTSNEDKVPIERINAGLTNHIKKFFPEFEITVTANTRSFEEDCMEFIKRVTKITPVYK